MPPLLKAFILRPAEALQVTKSRVRLGIFAFIFVSDSFVALNFGWLDACL